MSERATRFAAGQRQSSKGGKVSGWQGSYRHAVFTLNTACLSVTRDPAPHHPMCCVHRSRRLLSLFLTTPPRLLPSPQLCSRLLHGVIPALQLVAFLAGELRGRARAAAITQALGLQVRGVSARLWHGSMSACVVIQRYCWDARVPGGRRPSCRRWGCRWGPTQGHLLHVDSAERQGRHAC